VLEHEPGRRVKAVKNVSVNEDYFQGHFPGEPLMPGVLMIETMAQVAALPADAGRLRRAPCLAARRRQRQVPRARRPRRSADWWK
jgi:3-hydroxymyristoyl/3-hydroxydecanoyl-(acyl carrier protein) dehydratase